MYLSRWTWLLLELLFRASLAGALLFGVWVLGRLYAQESRQTLLSGVVMVCAMAVFGLQLFLLKGHCRRMAEFRRCYTAQTSLPGVDKFPNRAYYQEYRKLHFLVRQVTGSRQLKGSLLAGEEHKSNLRVESGARGVYRLTLRVLEDDQIWPKNRLELTVRGPHAGGWVQADRADKTLSDRVTYEELVMMTTLLHDLRKEQERRRTKGLTASEEASLTESVRPKQA